MKTRSNDAKPHRHQMPTRWAQQNMDDVLWQQGLVSKLGKGLPHGIIMPIVISAVSSLNLFKACQRLVNGFRWILGTERPSFDRRLRGSAAPIQRLFVIVGQSIQLWMVDPCGLNPSRQVSLRKA